MTASESSHAPLDVAFLRSLSEASELSLMTFLSACAMKRKKDVFHALADLLEQDGFVQGGLLAGKASLSLCLLQALASQNQGAIGIDVKKQGKRWSHQEREEAMILVTRFAGLHTSGSAERQHLLDTLLFRSCEFMHDAPFVKKLIELGANPDAYMASAAEKKFGSNYLIQEAAEHGNAALAGVVLSGVRENLKDNVVGGFVQTYRSLDDQPSPCRALALTLAQHPDEITDFLALFDQGLGFDKTAPLRARILSYHLLTVREQNQPWSPTCIDAVMGPPGGPASKAVHKAAMQDAEKVKEEVQSDVVDKVFKPLRELYRQALIGHCPSLVALFSERLREENDFDYKKPQDPLYWVCTAPKENPGVFDEHRFRATLDLLIDHGHRLDRVDTRHPPAAHLVAKSNQESENSRLQKFKVLLEMGIDPFQLSQTLTPAQFHLPKGEKGAWEGMARSFLARQVTSDELKNLIKEMDGTHGARSPSP